jgi:NAD(P)-dependent dehydrogenase (short-subunit alcohol dehydrogenase family)
MENTTSHHRTEFDLDGRVILLTGGLGLIGLEVADAFVDYGATVILTDLPPSSEIEERIRRVGPKWPEDRAIGLQMDVTSDSSVATTFQWIEDQFAALDILVNLAAIDAKFDGTNAGTESPRMENYPLEYLDQSIAVNITGMVRVTQHAIRRMLDVGRGNIINVASTYSLVAPNHDLYDDGENTAKFKPVDYVTTKSVVPNFTRYIATLYARHGIRCNCIVPHGVDNNHAAAFRKNFERLSPIGRLCDVTELRAPFLLLASEGSSYMTGSTLVVDGGWTSW